MGHDEDSSLGRKSPTCKDERAAEEPYKSKIPDLRSLLTPKTRKNTRSMKALGQVKVNREGARDGICIDWMCLMLNSYQYHCLHQTFVC